MDPVQLVEQLGVPIATAGVFGIFIWRQNVWIQNDLDKNLRDNFARIEKIIIDLINVEKKNSIDMKEMQTNYRALVTIIRQLSGNGLKKR